MFKNFRVFLLVAMMLSIAACGGSKSGSLTKVTGSTEVLATVDGNTITEKDVMKEIEPGLKRFDMEIYKMKKDAVENLVDKKLIEQAAAKQNKSPEDFMKEYIDKNMTEPTEDEIKKFYEYRKTQMGDKKFEEVKASIVEFLRANQKQALERKMKDGLRAAAKIDIKLEVPRIDLKVGNSPAKGPKNAPITLIEFSDYQCPFCGRARATINQVLEKYPNDVYYAFKDFPLSFHQKAPKAHEAAHCAGDQGKYWEMSKILFENQSALEISDLKGYAKKAGVDMGKFDKCLDEGKDAKKVTEGLAEGQLAGVSGTPAYFINGIMISGARPFENFKEIIDSELKRKK